MSDTPDQKMPDEPMDENLIMPLADGVVPAEQRAAAMNAAANDPEEFDRQMRTRHGGPIPGVYDQVLAAPIPEELLETVLGRATASAQSTGASAPEPSLLKRIGDFFRLPALAPALAIPAVIVATAAGWLAHATLRTDITPLEKRGDVASALQKALEQTPSGGVVKIAGGLELKPTFTFAGAQSWCRQYDLDRGTALRSQGLACRMSDGTWRVITVTEPEPPPRPSKPGSVDPAGAADIDALEGVRSVIARGDALDRHAVERLIADGWPATPGR